MLCFVEALEVCHVLFILVSDVSHSTAGFNLNSDCGEQTVLEALAVQ